MTWLQAPTRAQVQEAIELFFDQFHVDPVEAFSSLRVVTPHGITAEDTVAHMLYGLWQDLEDWFAELDDPSFAGPWHHRLTPLRQLAGDVVPWTFSSDNDPLVDLTMVNVGIYCDHEATDNNAQFEVRRTRYGFTLYLHGFGLIEDSQTGNPNE